MVVFTPSSNCVKSRAETGPDNDAFLGHALASKFKQLSPEESKKLLGEIIDEKIDLDKNGELTPIELEKWLSQIIRNQMRKSTDAKFYGYRAILKAKNIESAMTLEELLSAYKKAEFGDGHLTKSHKRQLEDGIHRFTIRFDFADKNKDGLIEKDEFMDLIHPEENFQLHPVLIQEALHEHDKNKDGSISMEEYVSSFVPDYHHVKNKNLSSHLVRNYEKRFNEKLDKNGDGHLTGEELEEYALKPNTIFFIKRTNHFLEAGDTNKDGVLSRQEILDNYEMYVGRHTAAMGKRHSKRREEL